MQKLHEYDECNNPSNLNLYHIHVFTFIDGLGHKKLSGTPLNF